MKFSRAALTLSLVALPLSLTLACDTPAEPEDLTLHISGKILRDDGSAASSLAVQLLRDGTEMSVVNTDSEGAYSFVADAKDFDGDLALRAQLSEVAGSAALGLDFTIADKDLTLPTLRFMEAPLNDNNDATDLIVSVPNYAGGDDRRPASYALQVLVGSEELALIEVSGSSSSVKVPRLLLQDFDVDFTLSAILDVSGMTGYARSARKTLAAINATPLSRDASCQYSSTVAPALSPLTPCALTDGDLSTAINQGEICVDPDPSDAFSECASTFERILVDLGEDTEINSLVLHELNAHAMGAGSILVFEQSSDAEVFTTITSLTQPRQVLTLPSPITARYLRISYTGSDTTSALTGFNEIAVY